MSTGSLDRGRLINYRANRHSQNGEDGVLNEIFTRLGLMRKPGRAVEFGAWDGMHLSNTFDLVERFGWSAVYIEGDSKRFEDLLRTAQRYPNILPVRAMISANETPTSSTLDTILEQCDFTNIDLLSIDIDSSDLEIWASTSCNSKVVVIEINSSIEPGLVRWHNPPKLTGNSFSATLSVARRKGYSLVCHTGNMVLVRDDLVSQLKLDPLDLDFPERLFLSSWIGLRTSLKERLLKSLTKFPPSVKVRIRAILRMRPFDYSN